MEDGWRMVGWLMLDGWDGDLNESLLDIIDELKTT